MIVSFDKMNEYYEQTVYSMGRRRKEMRMNDILQFTLPWRDVPH